jgi:hypothetical protein
VPNHFRKLIVRPEVPDGAFHELAAALRSRHTRPVVLVICDLKGRKPRNDRLKQAQEVGVRQIDIQGNVPQALLIEICDSTLGPSNWLYREQDDEAVDVCIPSPDWLENAFHSSSLAWLLEIEERPVPWNRKSLYAFPGNPPDWTVEMPINARLLHVAQPLEPRPCPNCSESYISKRSDRCQCPHCGYIAMPFNTKQDAARPEVVSLDAFSGGRCSRCRQSMQFTKRLEQCQRCGNLLKATSRHNLELEENAALVEAAVAEWLATI